MDFRRLRLISFLPQSPRFVHDAETNGMSWCEEEQQIVEHAQVTLYPVWFADPKHINVYLFESVATAHLFAPSFQNLPIFCEEPF